MNRQTDHPTPSAIPGAAGADPAESASGVERLGKRLEDSSSPRFDYAGWEERLATLQEHYRDNSPFAHAVLENFLPKACAEQAMADFPQIEGEGWIHYVHVNERKHGLNKIERLPDSLRLLLTELNSDRFVSWLSRLTGIDGLVADPAFEGGGLHQTAAGGYLNIHADFTVHPHKRNWRRRVNLLIYLNEPWEAFPGEASSNSGSGI